MDEYIYLDFNSLEEQDYSWASHSWETGRTIESLGLEVVGEEDGVLLTCNLDGVYEEWEWISQETTTPLSEMLFYAGNSYSWKRQRRKVKQWD